MYVLFDNTYDLARVLELLSHLMSVNLVSNLDMPYFIHSFFLNLFLSVFNLKMSVSKGHADN